MAAAVFRTGWLVVADAADWQDGNLRNWCSFAKGRGQIAMTYSWASVAILAVWMVFLPAGAAQTSAAAPTADYAAALTGDVKGLKIGIPKEYFAEGLDTEVRSRVEEGIAALEKLGCETVEISLPHTEYAVATYYLICTAEASANLARYDGVRYTSRSEDSGTLGKMYRNTRHEGFGKEVTRRIILGTYVLSSGYYDAYYRKAQQVRALIASDFKRVFETVDAIVTPVSPFPERNRASRESRRSSISAGTDPGPACTHRRNGHRR